MPIGSFENRVHRSGKDDEDFEKFVWEIFENQLINVGLSYSHVQGHKTRGKDGGIDHLIRLSDGGVAFLECKFFGVQSSNRRPKDIWRQVAKTLRENLLRTTDRLPQKSRSDIYFSWTDATEPVKGYIFCISADYWYAGEQEALRAEIENFFVNLGASREYLSHLKAVKAYVFGWRNFTDALEKSPPMLYRWMGGLPISFSLLSDPLPIVRFNEFLSNDNLPFFSRSNFLRSRCESVDETTVDEISLEKNLLGAEKGIVGLIVHGPGGIGKTRLALEIGRSASLSEWLVLLAKRDTKPADIERVASTYSDGAKVLIIFDYAEGIKQLTETIATISGVNRNGKHRFRFIATCRSSAYPFIQRNVEDNNAKYEQCDLSASQWGEYNHWVVRRILMHFRLGDDNELLNICGEKPIMAAFAAFLSKYHKRSFERQFAELHGTRNFNSWIDHRLRLAVESIGHTLHGPVLRSLATIGLLLPIKKTHLNRHAAKDGSIGELLDILLADKWIETDGDMYISAHDIFADALVAQYLFQNVESATRKLSEILINSIDVAPLDRTLVAVERLAGHSDFQHVDGYSVCEALFSLDGNLPERYHLPLMRGRLLSDEMKILLLRSFDTFAAAVSSDPSCDTSISYLALWADRNCKGTNAKLGLIDSLIPLVDQIVSRAHSYPSVVGRALRLAPARYSGAALVRIAALTQSDGPSLLISWLLAGLPAEEIADSVKAYLSNGGEHHPHAGRLITAWHDAGGDLAHIQIHIEKWLERYPFGPEASFVYKHCLYAKLNSDIIDGHLSRWVERSESHLSQIYTFEVWLETRGASDSIAVSIKKWLEAYESHYDAVYLYKAWLAAGGSPEHIKPHVAAWLEVHKPGRDLNSLLRKWKAKPKRPRGSLRAPGLSLGHTRDESNPVGLLRTSEKSNKPKKSRRTEEMLARIIRAIEYCRDSNESIPEDILEIALKWLHKHHRMQDASTLMIALINSGACYDDVRAYAFSWLSFNKSNEKALEIILLAIKYDSSPQITDNIKRYFNETGLKITSGSILVACMLYLENPAALTHYAATWERSFPKTFEAELLRHGGIIENFDSKWKTILNKTMSLLFEILGIKKREDSPISKYIMSKHEEIISWLDQFDTHYRSQKIIRLFINSQSNILDIERNVIAWLSVHSDKAMASEIRHCWIVNGGKLSDVELFGSGHFQLRFRARK